MWVVRWGGDRLCQTSPIPRSPDGDKKCQQTNQSWCSIKLIRECLVGMIAFFYFGTGQLKTPYILIKWCLNRHGHNQHKTECFRKDPYYIEIYITWMYLIFLYLVPFTLLAVFNILIFRSLNIVRTMIIRCNSYHLVCREVRRANKIRAQLSRNQKREIGFTQSAICLFLFFSSQNRCPY